MVDIHMENKQAKIWFEGDPMYVALDVLAAISGIYQGLHDTREEDAEIFKRVIQIGMQPDSPTWDRKHNMTRIVIPTKE